MNNLANFFFFLLNRNWLTVDAFSHTCALVKRCYEANTLGAITYELSRLVARALDVYIYRVLLKINFRGKILDFEKFLKN